MVLKLLGPLQSHPDGIKAVGRSMKMHFQFRWAGMLYVTHWHTVLSFDSYANAPALVKSSGS